MKIAAADADCTLSSDGSSSRAQHVFVAGALSGIVEGFAVQPLELLKTRMQINQGDQMRFFPSLREIVR